MTRNNLGEHLSWLLANIALSRPNAPSLPAAHDLPVDLSTPDLSTPISLPSQPDTRHPGSFGVSSAPGNLKGHPLPRAAAHVTAAPQPAIHPPEHLDEGGIVRPPGGKMGRLVSSSATKKRSLLVQKEQSQDQLLTPDSTSATSGRLQKAYAASLRGPGTSAAASRKGSPQRGPQRLVACTPDLTEDRDCETVDLTGSDDLLSSESNGFAFGDNVTVWTEDYARRPEPPSARRGTKRKSGEISQLHQPEPAADPFDEEFPDIFEIVGDTSIESIVRTTPNSSRKRKAARQESRDAVLHESPEHTSAGLAERQPPVTKRSPTKTTMKRAPSETPSIPVRRTPSPAKRRSPLKLDEEEKEVEASPRVSLPRTRRDSRVIQDSDEEWATPPTHNVSTVTVHSSTSRGDRKHSSPRHVRDKCPAIIAFDTPSKPRTYKSTASPTDPSPVKLKSGSQPMDHSPIKQRLDSQPMDMSPVKKKSDSQPSPLAGGLALRNASTPSASQTPTPSQSIPSLSDDVKAAILKLFLSRPSILQQHRSTIEYKLTQNRSEFRTALTSGQLGQTNALKREKDRLTAQLAALNVLSDEHQSYEYLTLEKDVLVEQMMEAYDQDMDAEESNKKLEGLVAEVSERESILITTLLKAGIDDVAIFEDRKPPATHVGRTEPTVQATQHSYQPPPYGLPGVSTQATSHSTQVIMQTQISQRHQYTSDSAFGSAEDVSFPRAGGGERGKVASSIPKLVGGSSIYKDASSTKDVGRSRPTSTIDEDLYDFGDDEEFFGYEPSPEVRRSVPQPVREPSSVRGRKTPASTSRYTDTFMSEDDYDDDADMLELAHDFELKQSSSESTGQRQGRSVFAETSGNIASSKPSKTAKRASSTSSKAQFPPELMKHPWSADVKRALKDRFRMAGFRHNQLEAINTTLASMDAFVLMPTGGGKSLCYQLPAVVKSGKTRGITIVVSPLLSLMQDQVDHLMALHIQAVSFNGEISKEARQKLLQLLRDPSADHYIDLLYVTPEMINKSAAFLNALRSLYQNKKLARLVIDEAHCVSQWGHDFRPDYKEIGGFRNDFPDVPLMALTATATPNVIVDVKHNLGIDRCQLFSQSFNRPNLYYEVRWKEKGVVDTIAELIMSKYQRRTGIVYTLSRKNAESTAEKLRQYGIAAHHYHAGMEPAQKEQVQKDWQRDKIRVVVATIAFGMGIDKPDVRFVIHQTLPKSLEGYYQETGRAGRDGQPSECYLFYNYGDATQLRKMISDGEGSFEQKERQRNMLNTVAAFADNQSDCRRVEILRYFGEAFRKVDCQATCDNCKTNGTFEMRDFTDVAVAVLGIVQSEKPLTMNQCTEAMQGLNKKKYPDAYATEHFGFGKKLQKHEIQRVIDKLAAEGALEEKNIFNKHSKIAVQYFTLGRKGHSYLNGRARLMLTVQVKGGDSQHSAPQPKTKTSKATRQTKLDTSKLPPSTNVSSPPARKRKGKGKAVAARDDDSDDEVFGRYENGYTKDDFVVPDDYDSFDDDFEEMEPPKLKQKRPKDPLGPPIARDAEMSSLDDVHQAIVAAFEEEVGPIVEKLQNTHSFRKPIFTTQQLRVMATRWTMTLDDMGAIPGIDQDKVQKFGKKIMPKIKEYFHRYEEIMGKNVPKTVAPPRPPLAFVPENYMDLVSTDDEEEMEDFGAAEEEDEPDFDDDDGEESRFFDGAAQPPPNVQRWHEEFAQASKTPATSSRPRSSSSTRGSSKFSRGGHRRGSRKYSGSSQRGRSGVSKKKSTASKRSSTGSNRSGSSFFSAAASTSTGRNARGGAGGSRGGSSTAPRQRIDTMDY